MTFIDWISVITLCALLFIISIFVDGNGGGSNPKF